MINNDYQNIIKAIEALSPCHTVQDYQTILKNMIALIIELERKTTELQQQIQILQGLSISGVVEKG